MEELEQERSAPAAGGSVPSRSAGANRGPLPVWGPRTWLVAIPLALLTIAAFIPCVNNGFVMWDDDQNFLVNPHFRGLGARQVSWAWTTLWVGAYQPLAWMLFEAQYVFFQLDPRAYHFTSLLLHVANAVVLYVLTVAFLVRCKADRGLENPWTLPLSAGIASALFAVHPLRVEAVAWVSCQPYLPCILFSMLSVLAYLHAFPMDSRPRRGWLLGSFLLFVAALLFKAVAVSLPALMLILDVYPLRRFGKSTGRWYGPAARQALFEKIPFAILSVVFMSLAIVAKPQTQSLVQHDDPASGIARACYAIWFYIFKTLVPLDISAYYPIPPELNRLAGASGVSILATLAMSAGSFLIRQRWPALLAAWLSFLVILAPNSGLILIGEQIAAGRYSYMSMIGSVMLAAAVFSWLWRTSSRWQSNAAIGIVAIGLGVLLGLTAMTRNQCRTWLNSETLWAHALAHGANRSFHAHNNMGNALNRDGKYKAAAAHYAEAVRLDPAQVVGHSNLGHVLARLGKYQAAEAQYAEVLRMQPGRVAAHNSLGIILAQQIKYNAAKAHFTEAVRLDPGNVDAHQNLANVLCRLDNYEGAKAHYAEAIRLQPDDPQAYIASALIMATCPQPKFRDGKRAVVLATRACELTKWKDANSLNTLAAAYAEAGEFDAAVLSQKRALGCLTDERRKSDYRARLVRYRAKTRLP